MKSRSALSITSTAGLETVNLSETIYGHLQESTEEFNFALNPMFIDFLLNRENWKKSKHLNISASGTSTLMGTFNDRGSLLQALKDHQDHCSRISVIGTSISPSCHQVTNQLMDADHIEAPDTISNRSFLPFCFSLNPFDESSEDLQIKRNLLAVSQFIADRFHDGWGGPWVLYNEGEISLVYALKRDQNDLTEDEWGNLYKGLRRRYRSLSPWWIMKVMGLELPYVQPKRIWPFHRSSPQGNRVVQAGGSKRISLSQVRSLLGVE